MRTLNNLILFLAVYFIISFTADLYYYNRVVQEGKQISYSDFRVFWFASYNLSHHILKWWVSPKCAPEFRPLWFLNPSSSKHAVDAPKPGQCVVYDKREEFYHFRYSPFAAFIMIPVSKIKPPGNALLIWLVIINISFLASLLLAAHQLNKSFKIHSGFRRALLWIIFMVTLRFYLMDISLGQTNVCITLFLVLFLLSYIRNKYLLSGLLLAFVLQFKPFFVFFLIYFLLTGRVKIVLSAFIGFFFFLIIPAYMLGIEKVMGLTRDWIAILNMSISSQILNDKNQSLTYAIGDALLKFDGVKAAFGGPWKLFSFVSAAMMSLVYAAMLRLKKHEKNPDGEIFKYLEVSLLIVSCLLFSPISWGAHYAAVLIPFSVALYFGIARVTDKKLQGLPYEVSVVRKVLYTFLHHKKLWYSLGIFFLLSCVVGTDLTKYIPYINSFHSVNIGAGAIFLTYALIYGYRGLLKNN